MKKIIIYGAKAQAEQLFAYITLDNCDEVCAFVVDEGYKFFDELLGLPVYLFDEAISKFSCSEYDFAISFAYQDMMNVRKEKFLKCKNNGYNIYSYVSKDARVYTSDIGEGNIIYPGCTIAPGVQLGDGNFLEIDTSIAHHCHIGNFNFFSPAATICGEVTIGNHCFLASQCAVVGCSKISDYTLVSAGAIVTKDTDEYSVLFPARGSNYHSKSSNIKI